MVTSATVTSGSIVAHMDAGICDPIFLGDHRLVVRDQATLEILWTAQVDSLSNVTPTIADGRIYVNQAGTVLAYDAAGCGAPSCLPVWTTTGDGIAVNDPVVAAHGQVYLRRSFRVEVPSHGVFEYGRLEVLDANDGTPLWQAPYSVGTDPGDAAAVDEIAPSDDRIYVVAYRNQGGGTPVQRVLDAYPASGCGQAECTPEWSAPLDGSFRRLMIGGDVVYANTLVALAADGCGAATCKPLANVPVAVGVVQHMVISAGPGRRMGGGRQPDHGRLRRALRSDDREESHRGRLRPPAPRSGTVRHGAPAGVCRPAPMRRTGAAAGSGPDWTTLHDQPLVGVRPDAGRGQGPWTQHAKSSSVTVG